VQSLQHDQGQKAIIDLTRAMIDQTGNLPPLPGIPESRCLVPFTSFSENELTPGGSKQPIWFAFDRDRPLAFFAGIWTRWTSIRKVREGEVTADLFGFLTTEPNAEVATVHPQAMPAILTTEEEFEV
jgi:putative SOS response-associated peptidase YedK